MMPGPMEITILLLVALVLFGHKRLGELASSMGKALRNFRDGLHQSESKTEKLSKKNLHVSLTAGQGTNNTKTSESDDSSESA